MPPQLLNQYGQPMQSSGPSVVDAALGAELMRRARSTGDAIKQTAKGASRRMALSPQAVGALRGFARFGVPISAGLVGILDAVNELEDTRPGETRGKNTADALGRGAGSTLGAILGGIGGGIVGGPFGAAGGSVLGSYLLGNAGRGVGGALFNLISDPESRAAYQEEKRADRRLAQVRRVADMQLALDRRRMDDAAARDLEANYQNAVNQMMLNNQILEAQEQAQVMAMLGR
jgi:hypothetical protein|tara:strand:+ start:73 stop:768 length:696 start_codon:yes stop_codon:yes gene_type:complete